jgi:hypothetical protein
MDTPVQQVTWAARYGIAQRDWEAFSRYAGANHVYLLLRGGPAAAIPWIERGFPARPSGLSTLDVDGDLGLLVARGETQRHRVFAHCHYVLMPAVPPRAQAHGGQFIGVNPRQPPLRVTFRERWARAGVVIDRRAHRPFTAGYELVAVIGEGDEFHHFQTLGSAVGAAAPLGWRRGPDPDRSTRFVDQVRQDLNGLLGSERVLDGTRGQARGPSSAGSAGSSADVHDQIVIFRPDGGVGLLRSPAGAWSRLEVRVLVAALQDRETPLPNL